MHTFYPKGLLENTHRENPTHNGLSQRKWNVFCFFCFQQHKYGFQDYSATEEKEHTKYKQSHEQVFYAQLKPLTQYNGFNSCTMKM